MKEKLKQINWANIGWKCFQGLIVAILNTPLWVYLIGSFVPYSSFGEFKLSWIDYLRLSDKVAFYHIWLLYIGIAVGIIISISFIKWLYEAGKKKKQHQEMIDAQKEQTAAIVKAISKEQAKEKKDVEKYLGD